ncbi:hypothetical protein AXG93_1712s1310 [Marchantia polymorpha subsp. ruderalis]|uniref:Uncharacterized protein n=1 Tax=Marchantia polymorpha subsp. ruderalis TaxID=1480154 RepID=A0A176W0F1_MARPO|nr:hypothetical protein AXG93_1712s1310 [Marchantia polymorpha subsp. ruderalis]
MLVQELYHCPGAEARLWPWLCFGLVRDGDGDVWMKKTNSEVLNAQKWSQARSTALFTGKENALHELLDKAGRSCWVMLPTPALPEGNIYKSCLPRDVACRCSQTVKSNHLHTCSAQSRAEQRIVNVRLMLLLSIMHNLIRVDESLGLGSRGGRFIAYTKVGHAKEKSRGQASPSMFMSLQQHASPVGWLGVGHWGLVRLGLCCYPWTLWKYRLHTPTEVVASSVSLNASLISPCATTTSDLDREEENSCRPLPPSPSAPAAEVARDSQVNLMKFIETSDDIPVQQIHRNVSLFCSIGRASANRRPGGGLVLIFSWIMLNLLHPHKRRAGSAAMAWPGLASELASWLRSLALACERANVGIIPSAGVSPDDRESIAPRSFVLPVARATWSRSPGAF